MRTTIFASLIRFERFEWMLEKATELGVARVVPVQAERSEKGPGAGRGEADLEMEPNCSGSERTVPTRPAA